MTEFDPMSIAVLEALSIPVPARSHPDRTDRPSGAALGPWRHLRVVVGAITTAQTRRAIQESPARMPGFLRRAAGVGPIGGRR